MKMLRLLFFLLYTATCAIAQDSATSFIRLNHLGFYPNAQKIAVVTQAGQGQFTLVNAANNKTVFSGTLVKSPQPDLGGDACWIADFSKFRTPGQYQLLVKGMGRSYAFSISPTALLPAGIASIKAFYFMRCSAALPEAFAGKWHRAAGHPDTAVLVHPSAQSDSRLAGTVISSPRGWYDAGDYNKYIVNSGISTSTLLSLYEDFPGYMRNLTLHIPESGNGIPDVLNESLWNLRWMLTMQDPGDGGVYHKLTNASFDKMIMPDSCHTPRYVVQKSTAATLDFAAVMAQAARIFRAFRIPLPGLSDSCLSAARKAWAWAIKNPAVLYDQDAMNNRFAPKVTTGAYGDKQVADEFVWAAAELLVTTGDKSFIDPLSPLQNAKMDIPSWGKVQTLAAYTLIKNEEVTGKLVPSLLPLLKKQLLGLADELITGADNSAYKNAMSKSSAPFGWGSNSQAANQGIAFMYAYRLSHKPVYLRAALDNLDYLLGRNATGYCYVTGLGSKSPMHPHHRPSEADGIIDPIPGMLAGGPNPGMQDKVSLPSLVPDRAYTDNVQSYATNEIAINWNAPLAYLANAIQALANKLDQQ